jgi:hypothetical protein
MASFRIIAVHLTPDAPAMGWKHHHIHSVRCSAQHDTKGPTKHRVEVALDINDNKEIYYTVDSAGNRSDIEVFDFNGVKCIRSRPEGTRPDPLLLLPTF